jgi:hypothetical protein
MSPFSWPFNAIVDNTVLAESWNAETRTYKSKPAQATGVNVQVVSSSSVQVRLAEAAEAAAGDAEGSASDTMPVSDNTAAWDRY